MMDSCIRVLYQDRWFERIAAGEGADNANFQISASDNALPNHLEEEKARMDSIWQSLRTQSGFGF